MRRGDDAFELGQALPGVEHHLRHDQEIDARADRGNDVFACELAIRTRLDQSQCDPAAARVLAQDDVERIELATRGDDARHGIEGVENRAQALAGTGLGDHAVGAGRTHEPRQARPERRHFAGPRIPGAAQMRVPRGKALAHVVLGRIERPAERMVAR
jgi:hypothetical protein